MYLEIVIYIFGNNPGKRHFSQNPVQRYNFFLKYANLFYSKKKIKKYIYIVYIVYEQKMQKNGKYPMGILWVCYGYPMVPSLLQPYLEI